MRGIKFSSLVLPVIVFIVGTACSGNDISSDKGEEPQPIEFKYVVDKNGDGDFQSVQQAIDAVPSYLDDRTSILIKKGVYKELLTIPEEKKNITLVGEKAEEIILKYDNAADKIDPETGEEYGTSGSASTFIHGDGFVAVNITFENSAGTEYGPALAIYVDSDQSIFKNCRFLGRQDTFYGDRVRIFVQDSYIEGTVDFIFGPATAVFENCEIHSYGGTSITAASTESYVDFGFVFRNCSITSEPGVETDLGRPWRPYAAVAYLNSELGGGIKPEGWNNWGNTSNEATARYVEYNNSGPGAQIQERVEWVSILSANEAEEYATPNVLKTTYSKTQVTDHWDPYKLLEKMKEIDWSAGGG
ncbi:pectinesterase family protein [Fodinibius salsisoli]|uniref:Pectinesterase n=1 Tax=Fodinibius salsisoli TaxID=2820877 RepID=A0ABT3PKW0_9BACT|nr:pectinesterase family protein [Fodinibius salsisoli]MCW9706579.1 hypothetical protein [Fodinibius salsisoli]